MIVYRLEIIGYDEIKNAKENWRWNKRWKKVWEFDKIKINLIYVFDSMGSGI